MSFTQPILDFLASFPNWLTTVLIAMLPIFELRGSIPFALGKLDMPIWQAYLFSIIGNMIPVPFILLLLKYVVRFFRRFRLGRKFFDHLFERTRKRTGEKIKRYEALALVLFVAIPLPVTGAWTGALAAWLFDLELKRSMCYIFCGVLIAGVVVTVVYHLAGELLKQSVWGFIATVVFLVILYITYRFVISRNKDNGRNE